MNSYAPTAQRDNVGNGASAPLTVVVTGASAGIGRAVVREFAATGAHIGLIAHGRAGLEAGAAEVEKLGGMALVACADVADYEAVDRAAGMIEEEFGPIDIWVNGAFSTIFAPFREVTPEAFRRATEVTYLGAVYGTMSALKRMRPRDRGTIIQIGSALAKRSISLQSAYCGAKHGIDGFTESLRIELLHDRSGVNLIVVRMPGLNTPQFSWVRSHLMRQPRTVAAVYQPEIAARAVLYAAQHPARTQYSVGGSTTMTLLGHRTVPAVLDRYLGRTAFSSQRTTAEVGHKPGNQLSPLDDRPGSDVGQHGTFENDARHHSASWWLRSHARGLTAAAAASTVAIIAGGLRGLGDAHRHAFDPGRSGYH